MKTFITNTSKLVVSGTAIAAIGWVILTFYPTENSDGESTLSIKESTADILSMTFADQNRSQKFAASLEKLGHEEPRAYDYNGNLVFFSTNVVRESPKEVVRLYQRQFVEQGLNKKAHALDAKRIIASGSDKIGILKEASEDQDIVPYEIRDNYISMSGAEFIRDDSPKWNEEDETFVKKISGVIADRDIMKAALTDCKASHLIASASPETKEAKFAKKAIQKASKAAKKSNDCSKGSGQTCSELRTRFEVASSELKKITQVLQSNRSLNNCPSVRAAMKKLNGQKLEKFESEVKSFQSIEAFRKKGDTYTTVTATWSDENLDLKKVRTKHYGFPKAKEKQATVPLCVGCRRTWIYKGTGKEKPFGHEMIESSESPGVLADYYRNEMQKEGWKLTDGSSATLAMMKRKSAIELNTRWLHFARGDEHITLRLNREPNGLTKMTATRTD